VPVVVVLAPVGQACGRRARTAVPPRHQPACPLPCQRDALGDVAGAVPIRSTSSLFPSPSPSLSLTAPERCRRRRTPLPRPRHGLASPTSPTAPRHRPRPLRQATRRRTPRGAVTVVVFIIGRRRSPPTSRRLQAVPERAEITEGLAVSSSTEPLFSPLFLRSVAPSPSTAVAPRCRPCHRRRPGHRSPQPSASPCSWCHEGASEPLGWPSRALQPLCRSSPSSGRRRKLCSGELRPPRLLPLPH